VDQPIHIGGDKCQMMDVIEQFHGYLLHCHLS
jgi:hypothetical protein